MRLLAALAAAVLPSLGAARVVGVWTDIENSHTIVGDYLRNATTIAHTAGLRLAVDTQVGWGFAGNTEDPSRPVFEQVMDIVDELTIMDYFTSCSNSSRSRSAEGIGGHCDPTRALMLAAPFLNYAAFLQSSRNRTVLLDLGVALAAPGSTTHGRIGEELELELFLLRTKEVLAQNVGSGAFHNFAVFENGGYRTLASATPCPPGNPVCCNASDPVCTADGYRPSRAVWWYGMFGSHVRTTWKPANASTIAEIVRWCRERRVTELYVDQYCTNADGGCGGAPAVRTQPPTQRAAAKPLPAASRRFLFTESKAFGLSRCGRAGTPSSSPQSRPV